MKVRMLRAWNASEDGITVKSYEAGKAYDVPADLGEKWLKTGIAIEDKMIVAAPEVKVEPPAAAPEPPVTKPHKGRPKGRR